MRYGLRTLMIALIFGPPVLGWLVWPAARPFVDWVSPRDVPLQPALMVNAEWKIRRGKDGVLILEPPPLRPPGNWKSFTGNDDVAFTHAPSFSAEGKR